MRLAGASFASRLQKRPAGPQKLTSAFCGPAAASSYTVLTRARGYVVLTQDVGLCGQEESGRWAHLFQKERLGGSVAGVS